MISSITIFYRYKIIHSNTGTPITKPQSVIMVKKAVICIRILSFALQKFAVENKMMQKDSRGKI